MELMNLMKTAFLGGYASGGIQMDTIFLCLGLTAVIAGYICGIYRVMNRRAMYNRNFNLSLLAIAVITAAIILTIQSNIVVSLGMVGALSIVRFRTAIKDPMDLAFLFWAISVGIICGAGFAMIAVIASAILTVLIAIFHLLPQAKNALILVVNASSCQREPEIMETVDRLCKGSRVRSKNASCEGLSLALEIRTDKQISIVEELLKIPDVTNVSVVEYDRDIAV